MLTDLTKLSLLLESIRNSNYGRPEEIQEAEMLVIQLEDELKQREILKPLGFEKVDESNARKVVVALIESGFGR